MNTHVKVKTISIDAALIRGAQNFQANNNVRYYLDGILLAANGDIVATDGSILFKTYSEELKQSGLAKDLILNIDGKIPVSANTVVFDFTATDDDYQGATVVRCMGNRGTKLFEASTIDGRYPDYTRVIPATRHETLPKLGRNSNKPLPIEPSTVALNPAFLARLTIFKGGMTMHIGESHEAVTCTPLDAHWPAGTLAIIMPMNDKNSASLKGRDMQGTIT